MRSLSVFKVREDPQITDPYLNTTHLVRNRKLAIIPLLGFKAKNSTCNSTHFFQYRINDVIMREREKKISSTVQCQ